MGLIGDEAMFEHLLMLGEDGFTFVTLAVGVMGLWILCATAESILKTRARERTRREIAAYIAEGTISPEQGERLMMADANKDED